MKFDNKQKQFSGEDMLAFADYCAETESNNEGLDNPKVPDVAEWNEQRKTKFEKAIDQAAEKLCGHDLIRSQLFDLLIHETMNFKSKPVDGIGPVIEWQVMRTETGWLYIEENAQLQRMPITFFVQQPNQQRP